MNSNEIEVGIQLKFSFKLILRSKLKKNEKEIHF